MLISGELERTKRAGQVRTRGRRQVDRGRPRGLYREGARRPARGCWFRIGALAEEAAHSRFGEDGAREERLVSRANTEG